MFDPTVFDNLKVVIEGYIYDLDLGNEISIRHRSDVVDMATMSRKYSIHFVSDHFRSTYVKIDINMDQHQLAGELLQTINNPGCVVSLTFVEESQSQDYDVFFYKKLKRNWAENHDVKLIVIKEQSKSSIKHIHKYQINFATLFGEDDLEELLNIVDSAILLLRMKSMN
ncbi:hypothetical protein [Metabacillus litoralis]|uniref:hypothetical protein n=1 Tax=Metabacillus litoralis TaxID=152268 RepID=UPI001CFDD1AF|nr:hypothetical protein [Metabacillus litoralis]